MLDIFETGTTGQYFYDDLGDVWIHGALLVNRLGFTNVSQSIILHTEPEERQKPECMTGYLNIPWFVNESGVWNLVLKSKTKESITFKKKLCSEILPAIRKNGGYISDTATLDQTKVLLDQAQTRIDQMTEELTLSNLKNSQMSDYIQGESDRTRKAKESVTEDAIKVAVVGYVCVTEDTNGDALVFQTYLKEENAKYKKLLATVYSYVETNSTIVGRKVKSALNPHTDRFLLSAKP